MRHYWYTFFLFSSLLIFALYTGGKTAYDIWKEVYQISAERQEIEEDRTEKEEETSEEYAVQADPIVQEEVTEENAKSQETITEEPVKEEDVLTEKMTDEECHMLFSEGFSDVLFIGDSRTVGLHEYGQLEGAEVFADNGMSVFQLWKDTVSFEDEGKQMLEQVLEKKQYRVIHFMLGINELGYSRDQVVKKYQEAVKKVQELQPEAKIVLGANLHVTAEKAENSEIFNNENINELNEAIHHIAEEQHCFYVDVNELFDDDQGNLKKEYSADGAHILGKYYAVWVQWLQEGKS